MPFYDWGKNKDRLEMIRTLSNYINADVEHLPNC